jgi:hypothetical protein
LDTLVITHWMVELFGPSWAGGPKIITIDQMHIGWRLR